MSEVAIVACAELKTTLRSGKHVYELAGEVLEELLSKANLLSTDIDGFGATTCFSDAGNPFYTPILTDFLGLELDWCQTSDLGGASSVANVARAVAAIQSGQCSTVALIAADAQKTEDKQNIGTFRNEWQYPVGIMGPVGYFGLLSTRYDHIHGLNLNALAKLAVVQRSHAVMNDLACEKLRKPITEADYFSSPVISSPLRMLDCVMRCDGASGVLLMSADKAKALGFRRVAKIRGYGERVNFNQRDQLSDISEGGHSVAGPRALKQAGMSAGDIAMFHPYDDFLIAVMLQLEHIGFCKAGRGADFLLETDISHRGTLPINTGGGQISSGQPGLAGGAHNLVEAVRQLLGQAGERQVRRAENALVTGIGWIPYGRNWGVSNALVLEAV